MLPVNASESKLEVDCGCGLSMDERTALTNGKPLADEDWRSCVVSKPCRRCGEVHNLNFVRKKPVGSI